MKHFTLLQRAIAVLFFSICLLACEQPSPQKQAPTDTLFVAKPTTAKLPENTCTYDNEVSTLGIGLVIAPRKFEVFNDSLLTERWTMGDMSAEDTSLARVCPKFFKPDYGIMHFVCVGKTAQSYRILINYKEVKYLPKTTLYVFKTWETYLLQSFGVKRLANPKGDNGSVQPLKTAPGEAADTLSVPAGQELFCPVQLQGDWLEVKYDCFYNEADNPHEGTPCDQYISQCKTPLTGWLRWRKGEHLLIDIFLMP